MNRKYLLLKLVSAMCPNYSIMDMDIISNNGRYIGGFHDKWEWEQFSLKKLNEEELLEIFVLCYNSWESAENS